VQLQLVIIVVICFNKKIINFLPTEILIINHMKYFILPGAFGLSILLISSCASPRVELARMESIEVKRDEIKYRQASRRFIRLAQVGDLNGLIHLTSPRTLFLQGRNEVLENYKNKLIPALHNSRIEWNSSSTIIYDLNYNVGLEFSGIAHGIDSIPFYVSLFEEDGNIVVANIRKTSLPVKVKGTFNF
jgi:hypothetical protein